jgi:hypothetical protein
MSGSNMAQAMINVVTSCSREGWDEYGARFVETFLRYWPAEIGLFVVSEDELIVPHEAQYLNLLEHSAGARAFLSRHEDQAWVKGHATGVRPAWINGRNWTGYSFHHDAYKFCKKVFSVALMADRLQGGRLLWLDADVVTFAPVPVDFVDRLLPVSFALSCLERPGMYSECGFVGYNLDHPACRPFIKLCADLYESDMIFTLEKWDDCWAFDMMRRKCATVTHGIPHRSQSHPFINSELGKYMDHCKGPRKQRGRSGVKEQMVHRDVAYWRG